MLKEKSDRWLKKSVSKSWATNNLSNISKKGGGHDGWLLVESVFMFEDFKIGYLIFTIIESQLVLDLKQSSIKMIRLQMLT